MKSPLSIAVNNIKSKTKDHDFNLYIYNKVYGKIQRSINAENIEELCKKPGDAAIHPKTKKDRIESL